MSYITVPSDKVIRACDNYLQYIQYVKDYRLAVTLKETAEKRRLFGLLEPIGYQRACEKLEKDDTVRKMLTFLYGGQIGEIKDLRQAATVADTVTVSADMAYLFNRKPNFWLLGTQE